MTKATAKSFELEVLTEMTVTRKVNAQNRISFPCIRAKQGDWLMYTFAAKPSEIFPLFSVPHCDGDEGYQRHLNERRAQEIAAYLRNGNPIPGNIVLHVREEGNFEYSGKNKMLSFDNVPGALAVLDGQHRSWGGSLEGECQMFFTCFERLTTQAETAIFLDINTKQKKLPPALMSRIKGAAGRENATQARVSAIFDQMRRDENSAVYEKLLPIDTKAGMISHRGFQMGMQPVMRIDMIRGFTPENQYKVIDRIFRHGIATLGDHFFLTTVFGGFMSNAERIITLAMSRHGNLKDEALADVMEPLNEFCPQTARTGARLSKTDVINNIANLLGNTATTTADEDDIV